MHGGQNSHSRQDNVGLTAKCTRQRSTKTMLGLLQSAHASVQQRQCWAYCKVHTPAFNKDDVGLTAKCKRQCSTKTNVRLTAKCTHQCSTKTMLGLLQSSHTSVQQAVLHNWTLLGQHHLLSCLGQLFILL